MKRQSLRPRYLSEGQLSKVGVKVIDECKLVLSCCQCGMTWAAGVLPGGRLPPRYWHCTQGCNQPESPRTE
jgi:hypothetical protein